MSKITTHVLDLARGGPARGVPVKLERLYENGFHEIARALTDDDGRARGLAETTPGTHRLTFDTRACFDGGGFFPEVAIVFEVRDESHHHVPLLLSPFGYSTYRGS